MRHEAAAAMLGSQVKPKHAAGAQGRADDWDLDDLAKDVMGSDYQLSAAATPSPLAKVPQSKQAAAGSTA